METTSLALNLANLAAIALLPVVFFRRGRPNARWCLAAAPYPLAAAALVAAWAGAWTPWGGATPRAVFAVGGVLANAASLALIALTIGVHRVPLALWHQDDDAPVELVTWGPYTRVRHPFYAAFLLGLAAACAAAPGPATLGVLALAFALLTWTARREERRLAAGEYGELYRAYLGRTGRFLPRPTASRRAA